MSIEGNLELYPREILSRSPTPLDFLSHLSEQLGVKIYLKRDDLTDLALGGDKPRKLEYEIAQARAAGADILVTCGSMQSNHARLTTAAARKLGMDCVVVLSSDMWNIVQGNLLTVYLMGAQVKVIDNVDHWELETSAIELCETLHAQGSCPHYIPVSGTTPHSCLGYVRGALETLSQLPENGRELDAMYVPFGTGGIFAATLLALRERDIECPLIGISVNRDKATCQDNLDHWWQALTDLLRCDSAQSRGAHEIYDEFIGKEYGDPTEAALDAVMLMASSEGILLDPVYSGKVFSGLLSHVKSGRWQSSHTLLMLHSGGVPALFAYHEVIEEHLRKRCVLA